MIEPKTKILIPPSTILRFICYTTATKNSLRPTAISARRTAIVRCYMTTSATSTSISAPSQRAGVAMVEDRERIVWPSRAHVYFPKFLQNHLQGSSSQPKDHQTFSSLFGNIYFRGHHQQREKKRKIVILTTIDINKWYTYFLAYFSTNSRSLFSSVYFLSIFHFNNFFSHHFKSINIFSTVI